MSMKDLVVLAADRDAEQTLRALLGRADSLGIRTLQFDIFLHPQHDNGCCHRAHDFLRPFQRLYRHALVVFDIEGSGRETLGRMPLEAEVEERLGANGWGDRAAALVLAPELEVWCWTPSPHTERFLGWSNGRTELEARLVQGGWAFGDAGKTNSTQGSCGRYLAHHANQPLFCSLL